MNHIKCEKKKIKIFLYIDKINTLYEIVLFISTELLILQQKVFYLLDLNLNESLGSPRTEHKHTVPF